MARKAQSVSSSHGAYPNREQIGSFLWELWGRHLYHLPAFMLKGRPCGRCQHPFLQVLRRVWHPYMAGVWRPCCTLTVMENLGMDPWMGPKFVVRGLTVGWCNSLEIGDIYICVYIYVCNRWTSSNVGATLMTRTLEIRFQIPALFGLRTNLGFWNHVMMVLLAISYSFNFNMFPKHHALLILIHDRGFFWGQGINIFWGSRSHFWGKWYGAKDVHGAIFFLVLTVMNSPR